MPSLLSEALQGLAASSAFLVFVALCVLTIILIGVQRTDRNALRKHKTTLLLVYVLGIAWIVLVVAIMVGVASFTPDVQSYGSIETLEPRGPRWWGNTVEYFELPRKRPETAVSTDPHGQCAFQDQQKGQKFKHDVDVAFNTRRNMGETDIDMTDFARSTCQALGGEWTGTAGEFSQAGGSVMSL